jgi:hypothetical protein
MFLTQGMRPRHSTERAKQPLALLEPDAPATEVPASSPEGKALPPRAQHAGQVVQEGTSWETLGVA